MKDQIIAFKAPQIAQAMNPLRSTLNQGVLTYVLKRE
jgi:hypothetical protein